MEETQVQNCRIVIGGEEIFSELKKFIQLKKFSAIFILTDENVDRECLPVLFSKCDFLTTATLIEIPSGESEKNISVTAKIISLLLENNADRKSLLINFGGGVISDLGGFTAAIYKRGIRFINIPTSLLSMVDASVGGKTGINFLERKNVIGTFTNPEAVFIYPEFLDTLPENERRSGFAEIIKHVILSDVAMWEKLLLHNYFDSDKSDFLKWICHSVKFKSSIVENDFLETGQRAILNFGHTIGHTLESYFLTTVHPLLHGEAVAMGMIAEIYLSNRLTGFPEDEMLKAQRFIKSVFNDLNLKFESEDLVPYLFADKKNANDRIAFSLLKSPGIPAGIIFPDIELIIEAIGFLNDEFTKTLQQ